jgi:hypothetical protein
VGLTVRPPRLGGNKRLGVFATRSPFRPNGLGLSSVKIVSVGDGEIEVAGADLMDGTPIYDIKPYLPYTDSHPDARSGFATQPAESLLEVCCLNDCLSTLPPDLRKPLLEVLAHDPRPQYQHNPERVYGMAFAGYEVRFRVEGDKAEILSISPA